MGASYEPSGERRQLRPARGRQPGHEPTVGRDELGPELAGQDGPVEGVLTATGKCLHLGKSIAFCEAQVHNADGKLAATASGTRRAA